jgi:hypothetical protein
MREPASYVACIFCRIDSTRRAEQGKQQGSRESDKRDNQSELVIQAEPLQLIDDAWSANAAPFRFAISNAQTR